MTTITTIKLKKNTKSALNHLKEGSESYDSAISRLISSVGNANLKAELIEAYKNMGKKDLQFLEEWNIASKELEYYG
ncbi:MAG: hypothetical protein AABX33_02010 [Nanoarchaeota archaeon]